MRRPDETWETLERRLRGMCPADLPAALRKAETSVDSLAAGVREDFARMLADGKAAGHRVGGPRRAARQSGRPT